MSNKENIIVINQHVKLESLGKFNTLISSKSNVIIVSTQLLFENEREKIDYLLGRKCSFLNFADLMSDAEAEKCDVDSFSFEQNSVMDYYESIKIYKNKLIISKLSQLYPLYKGYITCDGLGIHLNTWLSVGYEKINCEYYYYPSQEVNAHVPVENDQKPDIRSLLRKVSKIMPFSLVFYPLHFLKRKYRMIASIQMYVAKENGNIYWFLGSMNRIAYRLNLKFKEANFIDKILFFFKSKGWYNESHIICLSTLHEANNRFSDRPDMNVKLMQDGYLPPNYSSKYLLFFGKYVEFWTWDVEGLRTFHYHQLPCRVIPIRKKLYLPEPNYPIRLKKVLCAASGDGDWTAIKNRSDEDNLVVVFAQLAKAFPDVDFVFRCHPVWVYPVHQGVNSINRVVDYYDSLHLSNLSVSSNIPQGNSSCLSFKRSSYENDLQDVDLVLGEHSIAMVDAGFKKKIFCSVNVTGHRDFYLGMTEMGFPHCEKLQELIALLRNISSNEFKDAYHKAVLKYNEMTDLESK